MNKLQIHVQYAQYASKESNQHVMSAGQRKILSIWPTRSLPQALRNSEVRASNQCVEGHRLKFLSGTQICFCPAIVTC